MDAPSERVILHALARAVLNPQLVQHGVCPWCQDYMRNIKWTPQQAERRARLGLWTRPEHDHAPGCPVTLSRAVATE